MFISKKKGAQQNNFQWALAFMASLEHSTHSVNKMSFSRKGGKKMRQKTPSRTPLLKGV